MSLASVDNRTVCAPRLIRGGESLVSLCFIDVENFKAVGRPHETTVNRSQLDQTRGPITGEKDDQTTEIYL